MNIFKEDYKIKLSQNQELIENDQAAFDEFVQINEETKSFNTSDMGTPELGMA
jgi:hypothetical protein